MLQYCTNWKSLSLGSSLYKIRCEHVLLKSRHLSYISDTYLLNTLVGERFVEGVAALQEQLVDQKGDGVHGEGSGKGRPLLSSSTAF